MGDGLARGRRTRVCLPAARSKSASVEGADELRHSLRDAEDDRLAALGRSDVAVKRDLPEQEAHCGSHCATGAVGMRACSGKPGRACACVAALVAGTEKERAGKRRPGRRCERARRRGGWAGRLPVTARVRPHASRSGDLAKRAVVALSALTRSERGRGRLSLGTVRARPCGGATSRRSAGGRRRVAAGRRDSAAATQGPQRRRDEGGGAGQWGWGVVRGVDRVSVICFGGNGT